MLADIVHPMLCRPPGCYLELVQYIRGLDTLEERIAAMAGAAEDEDAWVIAPGPSLRAVPRDVLYSCLSDKLVIAAKRAYPAVVGIASIHIINSDHFEEPNYGPIAPLSVATEKYPPDDEWTNRWDLTLPYSNDIPKWASLWVRSVCGSRHFTRWELSKTIARPPGPGIMDELGFYLPVHLGCKRIFTMGFDLERTPAAYYDGATCPAFEDDSEIVVAATKDRLDWLHSLGIEWYRIDSNVDSRMNAPTMSFSEAVK